MVTHAREARRPDGLRGMLAGTITERRASQQNRRGLKQALDRGLPVDETRQLLSGWLQRGLLLTTVLDKDYPLNLRTNSPAPALFYGKTGNQRCVSVAVVGTRTATDEGLLRAKSMARLLAERNVTVLSGLARGIDTAAHEATLAAAGRTIAVLGSGLLNVYPPENRELAGHMADSGAVVSQFWPDAPPAKYNFPAATS